MDSERWFLALAALLHDVGKLGQRAKAEPGQPLAPGYEAFGKEDYGQHGAHATWSAWFAQECVPERWRGRLQAIFYHHRPVDRASRIVALTDHLSAAERRGDEEEQPQQLLSIFCCLGERPPGPHYLPLKPLRLAEDVLFPSTTPLSEAERRRAYGELWDSLVAGAKALQEADDLKVYLEGVYELLRQYTWCVPSAFYKAQPDVSLFDHGRTAAALAACLADQEDGTIQSLLDNPNQDVEVARLVCGDLSGVQAYIYKVIARGAAKNLRGRSVYLQLLTLAVARCILRRLDLPVCNLLYVGGGRFFLLVPPAADLSSIQGEVSEVLWRHHQGDLYLALGSTPLKARDFALEADKPGAGIADAWRKAGQAAGEAKARRFAELGPAWLSQHLFAPQNPPEEEKELFQEAAGEEATNKSEASAEEATHKSPTARQALEALARDLHHAEFLLLAFGEGPLPSEERGTWRAALGDLGLAVRLFNRAGEPCRAYDDLPKGVEYGLLWGLREAPSPKVVDAVRRKVSLPMVGGVRFLANVSPRVKEEDIRWIQEEAHCKRAQRGEWEKPEVGGIKEFNLLQAQARGLAHFGVLRMDVDNLGALFSQGFAQGRKAPATLSRMASLSFAFGLFFEGWVGEIARGTRRNDDPTLKGCDLVYVLYSGGDDLFIVGAWDLLPDLAHRIREDLSRFAAGNPAVHVSAGITLHGGKYPLYQAAQDAHDALEAAKDRPGKDAWCFLGSVLPWADYESVRQDVGDLYDLVEKQRVPKALLQDLRQLYLRYLEQQKEKGIWDRVLWGPWMWWSAYRLTRMAGQLKDKGEEVQRQVLELRDRLKGEKFHEIRTLGLAARWAELLTRGDEGR